MLITEKMCLFSWLLTGFGKSLCYEALPYVIDYKLGTDRNIVLVILPLVLLMIDQVYGVSVFQSAMLSSNIFLNISVILYTPMTDTSDIFPRISIYA